MPKPIKTQCPSRTFLLQKIVTVKSRFFESCEKTKRVPIIATFEKSGGGLKLRCLTRERGLVIVRFIEMFEELRAREIGIPLYFYTWQKTKMLWRTSFSFFIINFLSFSNGIWIRKVSFSICRSCSGLLIRRRK